MQIIKNYRNNDTLRASFNRLTEKVFCFTFDGWYDKGFWNDKYIPYSLVEDGEVIANVSVNIVDINDYGTLRHYIQLGTVMTDEKYRNRGYIRILMNEIFKDYGEKVDGIYLFAGDDVKEFYPKFGFTATKEYQYSKAVDTTCEKSIEAFPADTPEKWQALENAFDSNAFHGGYDMVNNFDLMMFHITGYMQNSVYFDKQSGAYVVADVENDSLFIHMILSSTKVTIDDVVKMFGKDIKTVTLGFTPCDASGWNVKEYFEEDCTLFLKDFSLDDKKIIFQTLSHA